MDISEKKYPIVENEHLYSVLNLSKYASPAEVNERHKHLSLIFHPDKQVDEQLKAVATKEFLEIQKAYQVLSDPFLRQVYDTLGSEGLSIKWPPTLRSQTKEQISDILSRQSEHMVQQQLKQKLIPRGRVQCSIDATPLFSPYFKSTSVGLGRSVVERFKATQVASQQLSYTVEKKVSDKTILAFTGQTSFHDHRAAFQFLGTIRHHFSPRLLFLTGFTFHHPYPARFEVKYEDTDTAVDVKTTIIPPGLSGPPPLSVSVSRRLFRSSNKRGKIDLNLNNSPSLSFFYVSPPTINMHNDEEASFLELQPPTVMGLRYVAFEKVYGLVFDRVFPFLVAETSMTLVELSTRFKASIQLGLSGLMLTLGAHWSGENTEAGASLLLSPSALLLQIDLSHMGQQLALPIVLSDHHNPPLALGTIVLPTTATLLAYRFFIIPRRRARRYAHMRAAKKSFDEDTDSRRERNAVERLLRDAVKRQVRQETEKSGLIFQEAIYAVAETDLTDVKDNLSLDVTIPLQALVHNSQLHISGGNTKAALQGFSDPAPFASKVLRIRYLFRGRMHYAEIPDYLPVVLPLSDHLVDG